MKQRLLISDNIDLSNITDVGWFTCADSEAVNERNHAFLMNMIRVQSVAKENNMNNVFDETLLPYQEIRFN